MPDTMFMKERMLITGGHALQGTVHISGGKNTAVAVIPATLLCDEPCTIENLPDISDVHALVDILCSLGAKVNYEPNRFMTVDPRPAEGWQVSYRDSQRLRASYYLLGALLGRRGQAEVYQPGGCEIGSRPIDQHLKGFRMLGANVEQMGGRIKAKADVLTGTDVVFDCVSVGATINVMLAAAKAHGTTIIYNAAKEPHVVDLANFLNSMGARVKGAGTDVIRIFGRDYLQVGMYTDVVFPEFGVHFIAVNDGVDSTRGESEFTAIRNVFNEMYARDTSKKIRATWQSKGKSGEHLTTIPPYGYMKSPEDKKKWIVDEEAAAVVQKIFSLCASGKGPTQIAKWLKQQQILNPTAYCHAKGLPTSNKLTADPYKWTNETVSRILERVDYLGHTVNFKTTKQSYKSKKKIWNDPENWVIFENTQPPIIEESVFLIVQNIRKARRRPTKMGEMGMFSGLLYCAECGGKMYQCRATNFAENQKYFICSTYRKGKDLCTTHSIKNVVLHEIVLRNLREAISYVSEHEAEFIQDAAESDMRDRDAEFVRKRETLAKADTRIAELDRIISRLYEDNVIGKLSDERFIKMSHDYELEQSNLKAMAEVLREEIKQQEKQKTNVKAFISAVKKYTDMQQLDAAMLREFIDRIEVSHTDKKSKTREITIVYNFIGAFDFTRAIENARNTSKKEQRTA
mgnify:FL=1